MYKKMSFLIFMGILSGCNFHKNTNDSNDNNVVYGMPDFAIINNPGQEIVPKINPEIVYEGSLVVISIPYGNIGEPYMGKAMNFQQEFINAGSGGSGLGIIIDNDVQNFVTGQYPVVSYVPHDIQFYKQEVTVGAAGTYTFKMVIDPLNKFSEITKSNNEISITINVIKFPTTGG